MTTAKARLRRLALVLGAFAIVLGGVAFVALLWVVSQTDTGMMCSAPYTKADRPGACSIYDAPWWTLGIAALCATVAFVALLASLPTPRRPSRS